MILVNNLMLRDYKKTWIIHVNSTFLLSIYYIQRKYC